MSHMELFNNKENEILKFKINSEGIDVNNIEPRLILITKENKNVLLIGEIDKDICRFNIPELTLYEKGDNGKIKFEIISEDLYFPVWEDKFEIKTKASIKVDEVVEIHREDEPKKVSFKAILETEKKEPIREKSIKENKKIEQPQRKIEQPKKEEVPIKHFNDFFGRK